MASQKDEFGPWGARGSKAHPGEGAGLPGRSLGGRNKAAGRGDSSRNPTIGGEHARIFDGEPYFYAEVQPTREEARRRVKAFHTAGLMARTSRVKDGWAVWTRPTKKSMKGFRNPVSPSASTSAGRGDSDRNPRPSGVPWAYGIGDWVVVSSVPRVYRGTVGKGERGKVVARRYGFSQNREYGIVSEEQVKDYIPGSVRAGDPGPLPRWFEQRHLKQVKEGRMNPIPSSASTYSTPKHPGDGAGLPSRKVEKRRVDTVDTRGMFGHQVIVGRKLPGGVKLKNPSSQLTYVNTLDQARTLVPGADESWVSTVVDTTTGKIAAYPSGHSFSKKGIGGIARPSHTYRFLRRDMEDYPIYAVSDEAAKVLRDRLFTKKIKMIREEITHRKVSNPDKSDVRLGTCPSCGEQIAVPRGTESGNCGNCGGSFTVQARG